MRSPVDGHWYTHDDSRCNRMNASELKTSAAYVLFYIRRPAGLKECVFLFFAFFLLFVCYLCSNPPSYLQRAPFMMCLYPRALVPLLLARAPLRVQPRPRQRTSTRTATATATRTATPAPVQAQVLEREARAKARLSTAHQ